jgi:hypothetical protein
MSNRNCSNCNKPLGSTYKKCHSCGGKSRRGGDPIAPHSWQLLFGVEAENLKTCDLVGRDYDMNSRGSVDNEGDHSAGES